MLGVVVAMSSGSSTDSDIEFASTSLRAVDVAGAAGIGQTSRTHGKNCVADFDGDGETDLLVSAHEDPWRLYLGTGDGRFVLDDKFVLARLDRHGCAVADYNADGLLDVYFAVGACRGTCRNAKELWVQQADGTFVDEAEAWGIADPGGRGRVPVVLDANGDDLPDLFTAQQVTVDEPSLNRLWINRGDYFELQDQDPLTNALGANCAAAADVNGDGLDEVALCSPDNGFFLFRNTGGSFVDGTDAFGMKRTNRRNVVFADMNGDDRPDLVTIGQKRMQVYLNDAGWYGPAVYTLRLDSGKDVAVGDVDADGDLDVYVQQGIDTTEPDVLLLNEGDGRQFRRGPELPSTDAGGGDSVTAIPDYKGTGRAAFIVNNGYQTNPGPRQLIEFR